jgi:hypothetical protein
VRPRGENPGPTSVPVGKADTVAERLNTLEELLREARSVLATLPASDPQTVLLGLAVHRRDGILLTGVLAKLREGKERDGAARGQRSKPG